MQKQKRIIVANPHGFCAGVRRAIESIESALNAFPPPIYCLNEIVHNRRVVDELSDRGVVFVKDVHDVPRGACVVFSAHGVSPAVRRSANEAGLRVLDATCPFVKKLHTEVRDFVERGFEVLLIGHRGHDEIVGIQGEAPERILVVENRDEARSVQVADPRKVATVTQTTLSVDETASILDILRSRFPRLQTPSRLGICHATVNRQEAVKRLAGSAKHILVLGSSHSSNTKRLLEVAQTVGGRSFLIDSLDALKDVPLDDVNTIGITAGASTPETFLSDVIDALKTKGFNRVEYLEGREEEVHFSLPEIVRDASGPKNG